MPPQPTAPPMDAGITLLQAQPNPSPMDTVIAPQEAPLGQPAPVPPEAELVPLQPTLVLVVPPEVQLQQELDQAHAHETKNEQQQDEKDVRVIPVEEGTNACAAHHHKDEEQSVAARGRKAGGVGGTPQKRAAPGRGARRGSGEKHGKLSASTQTAAEAQAPGPPIAPMSPYACAEEAAPPAQAQSAALTKSSVVQYLERASPATPPAITPVVQDQEQEQEQEAIVGPFSADELRRWHEWDEYSYQFGLLTRPDMAFAEDMFAWAAGM